MTGPWPSSASATWAGRSRTTGASGPEASGSSPSSTPIPAWSAHEVADLAVEPIEDLDRIVKDRKIAIGMLATPAAVAQDVADQLVAAGVRSILNFAPAVLSVPEGVSLRKVDLAIELQILSFYQLRRGLPAGVLP